MMRLLRRFLFGGWTNLVSWCVRVLFVVGLVIIILAVLYWRSTLANAGFLSNVTAELVGIILSSVAAVPISILVIDRYQRRQRTERWRRLGEEVAQSVIATLEIWIIYDLSEINPTYREESGHILVEPETFDWQQPEAGEIDKLLRRFNLATKWLAQPDPSNIEVETLALFRLSSQLVPRRSQLRELKDELRSSGIDDPDLYRYMRRLQEWWEVLHSIFSTFDLPRALSDQTNPTPTYDQHTIDSIKRSIANRIIVFMRYCWYVRQILLAYLPPTDARFKQT